MANWDLSWWIEPPRLSEAKVQVFERLVPVVDNPPLVVLLSASLHLIGNSRHTERQGG